MSDAQQPIFQIQRMYLKDLSLEIPGAPRIFLEQQAPSVEISLDTAYEGLGDSIHEITVTSTVTTKLGDKVMFLIEAKQAGIFEIKNVPKEQMQPVVSIVCPGIIYPYLRAIVSDVCTRGGFPPVVLAEVNFQAMYEAQRAQAAAGNAPGAGTLPN